MTLTFTIAESGEKLTACNVRTVIGGYTGANPTAVQHHIDELAAIGVPPPSTVPAFYPMPPGLATQAPLVRVPGPASSGEVEPVLVRVDGRLFLSVGSDHTDREIERESVARSKEVCPKPVSRDAIELPREGLDWSSIVLQSSVDGVLYQEDRMSALLPPTDVLSRWDKLAGGTAEDVALFCGTVPLIEGTFTPGQTWRLTLELPSKQRLTHEYTVTIGEEA